MSAVNAALLAAVLALSQAQVPRLEPALDGGFTTDEAGLRESRRRVLDLHLPETSQGSFVLSDSRAAETTASWSFVVADDRAAELVQGAVRYRGVGSQRQDVFIFQREDRSIGLRFGGGNVGLRWTFGGQGQQLPDGTLEFATTTGPLYRLRADVPLRWTGSTIELGSLTPFLLTIELALVHRLVDGPSTPNPAWGATMAWDGDGQRLIRVGGTGRSGDEWSTWAWTELTGWVDLGLTSPPPRARAALVWNRASHSMLLFGGSGTFGLLNDTWELTATGWIQRYPAQSPSPRWAHAMAYDERRERPVLFGGLQGNETGPEFDDTWEWTGSTWVRQQPVSSPRGRDAHGLAWSGALGEVVLFGGWDGFSILNDTWTWDGLRWRQLSPLVSPPPRSSLGLSWDPVRQLLLMTSGWDPRGAVRSDTWTFDGVTWTQRAAAPAPWMRMALATHPRLGVVAFGGADGPSGAAGYDWTLAHDGQQWRPLTARPPVRGALVVRAAGVSLLSQGTEWTARDRRWRAGPATPFSEAAWAVGIAGGSLALVAGDAGIETWQADGDAGPWRTSLAPLPGSAAGLVVDTAIDRAWLMTDDGGLHEWRGTQWNPVALPSTRRSLGGAFFGQVLLVDDDVLAFEPVSGELSAFLPAPVAGAGRYTLQLDVRRDIFIAAGGASAGLFAEWSDSRWEPVSLQPERSEWLVSEGGAWVGWSGDAGLARYTPARTLGATCFDGRQCASGVCADGVCCDRDCGSSPQDCAACSAAAGAFRDGVCSTIRPGFELVCGGDGACLVAHCTPGVLECPTPFDACGPDAGPPRDAGRPAARPDAGAAPEPAVPASCQCTQTVPTVAWWALLAALRLSRKRTA